MKRKHKPKTKLPKNNGRPQLWMRDTSRRIYTQWEKPEDTLYIHSFQDERLRIIYPDGKTEYANGLYGFSGFSVFWAKPCWTVNSRSMHKQVQSMLKYDASQGFTTLFLGYL